jgi:hypothetical protein
MFQKKSELKMGKQRKVIDARLDNKGNISAVKIQGNETYTPLKIAIKMANKDELSNVIVVHPNKGKRYLRTKPDSIKSNNLDEMAKKK